VVSQQPFAVILCKFSDDNSEPYPRSLFEELFTSTGSGHFNMVDYFRDMSHGQVDISGSQVFGWHKLSQKQSDYVGSGANQQGREDLKSWARAAEPQSANFPNIVVITNVGGDLFGSSGAAVANDGRWVLNWPWYANGISSLCPSSLGHEMGHALGLNHAGATDQAGDYLDPWDVMSFANTPFMAPHPYFTQTDAQGRAIFRMGPGISAANMWLRGWLDMTRVIDLTGANTGTTVHLRPLHRPDLPGPLAIFVNGMFVEFRIPELWDSQLNQPVVLIHQAALGRSLIYRNQAGKQAMVAGDVTVFGDDTTPLTSYTRVRVDAIDPVARTATIGIEIHRARRYEAGPGRFLGAVDSGGGGILIIGGKIIRIPPRSPLVAIAKVLGQLAESEDIEVAGARDLVQVDGLARMSALTQQMQTVRMAELHESRALEQVIVPDNLNTASRKVRAKTKG
jgi:hypothetical protein